MMVQPGLTAAAILTYPILIIFLIYFMVVFHTRPLELGTPGHSVACSSFSWKETCVVLQAPNVSSKSGSTQWATRV